jgi:hypothetical protein
MPSSFIAGIVGGSSEMCTTVVRPMHVVIRISLVEPHCLEPCAPLIVRG